MVERLKRHKTLLIILAIAAGGALVTAALWGKGASASDYITAKIERSTVEVKVSATGTVQAVTTVLVGSQVSGTVAWLGADFNSEVKKGQIIAKLDPAIFQAQLDNARANVLNAEAATRAAETEISSQKANLLAAKANQEVARVQRDDALALVKRYQELKNVLSGRELEGAEAQANAAAARYEQATAQIGQIQAANESAKARLEQSKASLAQAKAQFEQATVNLNHTIIASPIDGVVVSRNVDVGQTVAASLQAPTLFTIANDLTKMQVLASIDEADVGQIRQGIKAEFQVDAYPGEVFSGTISQLRLNAQTLQNVVTYSAVIDVSNPELKLRPGMTANITIPVARKENVLTVPNAALRFKPELTEKQQQEIQARAEARRQQREEERKQGGEQAAQRQDSEQRRGQRSEDGAAKKPQTDGAAKGATSGEPSSQRRQVQTIWVLADGKTLETRLIRTGITNGRVTEIIGGDIHEGDTVVVGQNEPNGGNRPTPQATGAPFGQRPGFGGPRGPR
jgi:HlyD family secretion protein